MASVFSSDLRTESIRAHAMSNASTHLSTRNLLRKMKKYLVNMLNSTPHPKILDGINAPSKEELVRLGFSDVNTALANILNLYTTSQKLHKKQ